MKNLIPLHLIVNLWLILKYFSINICFICNTKKRYFELIMKKMSTLKSHFVRNVKMLIHLCTLSWNIVKKWAKYFNFVTFGSSGWTGKRLAYTDLWRTDSRKRRRRQRRQGIRPPDDKSSFHPQLPGQRLRFFRKGMLSYAVRSLNRKWKRLCEINETAALYNGCYHYQLYFH